MTELICGECELVFMSNVTEGQTTCPDCGSDNTYVAVYNEVTKKFERGSSV